MDRLLPTATRGDESVIAATMGLNSLIASLFCFRRSARTRFTGWYAYLIKPLLLTLLLMTVLTASICMGSMRLHDDEFLFALFMIIFPAVAFLGVAVIPARVFGGSPKKPAPQPVAPPPPPPVKGRSDVSSFKRLPALLLSAVSGFGLFGLHRFYVGKIGTGILWFFTGGMFLIGQIIDIIMICTGQFRDRYGRPLEIWLDPKELDAKTSNTAVTANAPAPAPARAAAAPPNLSEEEAQPAPSEYAPAPSGPAVPMSSSMYERFHPLAFLFTGLGFILTFIAVLVGLAHALHLPDFMATDQYLARDLEDVLGSNWPQILGDMSRILFVVLMLPAAVCISLGRRHLGARHLIRGILGLGGLLAAVLMLADGMYRPFYGGYRSENAYTIGEEFGSVLQRVLKGLQSEGALFAAILFVAAVVILAWPARPRKMMLTPALSQGLN
ncbi:MAG: TM2 domain-containing protein [Planctomycetota bacterium]